MATADNLDEMGTPMTSAEAGRQSHPPYEPPPRPITARDIIRALDANGIAHTVPATAQVLRAPRRD